MKTINSWKLLLLTALTVCAAACTDDPDEVPVIELGAVKGEYIVPAQSGTVEVEVYSNRGCNVCNDAEYYNRQYALNGCVNVSCNPCNGCNPCNN